MFNLDKFISDFVTKRSVSMFAADIEANKDTLGKEIKDKKVYDLQGRRATNSALKKGIYIVGGKKILFR